MKISAMLNYSGDIKKAASELAQLEDAGLDLIWVAEAYGFDSVSVMGYLAAITKKVEIGSAILPIYSRTPTLLAMTAAGLDAMTDGRFHLGLGASGPQVIEGFHGVKYTDPLGRTREIIEVCREVWKREAPLEHHGKHYDIPLPADVASVPPKALKIIQHPVRSDIPTWIAAIGEKNVELTAEVANGWIPILFVPEKAHLVWGNSLAAGKAKRDASLGELQITAGGILSIGEGDDVVALRQLGRSMVALYVGGMGAKGKNFYNTLACRYGYEKEAAEIQDLYLSGKKREAEALVPDELLELTSLCGSPAYIKDRIAAFAEAGVTHLQVAPVPVGGKTGPQLISELKELIG